MLFYGDSSNVLCHGCSSWTLGASGRNWVLRCGSSSRVPHRANSSGAVCAGGMARSKGAVPWKQTAGSYAMAAAAGCCALVAVAGCCAIVATTMC